MTEELEEDLQSKEAGRAFKRAEALKKEEERHHRRRKKREDDHLLKIAECTLSLSRAIQEAGGAISEGLLDMTLGEFITRVAGQNSITFTFNCEGKKESE